VISDKASLAHSASSVIASEAKQTGSLKIRRIFRVKSHAADGRAGKQFERFFAGGLRMTERYEDKIR